MIKADRYYIDNLTDIKDNGQDSKSTPKYADKNQHILNMITQVFEEYRFKETKGESLKHFEEHCSQDLPVSKKYFGFTVAKAIH